MGQYYRALLISDDGAVNIGVPYDFDNGYKLMEHSWIGNPFVDVIAGVLYEQPMRLAWVGDYSTDIGSAFEFGNGFIKSKEEFLPFYHLTWDEKAKTKRITKNSDAYSIDINTPFGFIVNESKGCFIDLNKYINVNKGKGDWCIHPLPLLTSVGNGLGGGDYRGSVGINNVGIWAFDRISISNLKPCNIKEVEYRFTEAEQEDAEDVLLF